MEETSRKEKEEEEKLGISMVAKKMSFCLASRGEAA